ncbi:MAG TPA: hypothetical protein P5309_07060 [Syntrophomonadaceae bacterium]|nr:hypothetical protein [Syntrophomonadaceae bacterium]
MTPLLFILVATVVLSVLILWVLRSVVNIPRAWPPQQDFAFESSSELALSEQGEYYLAQDSIRLQPLGEGWAQVSWNLSRSKLEQACAEYHLKPDPKYMVLRLQADNGHSHQLDLWVKSLAGQYRFQPDPHTSYCAILGISQYQQFLPILTSVTISSLAGK